MKTELTKDDQVGWYECVMKLSATDAVRYWDGKLLHTYPGQICGFDYTSFRRLYTKDEFDSVRAEADKWAFLSGKEKREILDLKAELNALKAAPYPMRKAEKPDCVGLWLTTEDHVFPVDKHSLDPTFWAYPPYYYLGPIPVIPKEQLPPKVMRIRHDGKEMRAIASDRPDYWTLLNDDGIVCGVAVGNVEVI